MHISFKTEKKKKLEHQAQTRAPLIGFLDVKINLEWTKILLSNRFRPFRKIILF